MDLPALAESWALQLRAERKAKSTIVSYLRGVEQFLDWCDQEQRAPLLDRPTVNAYIAARLAAGAEPNTARIRLVALCRFSAWLADEHELERDELVGIKPPRLDAKVVQPLTEDQLRALLKTCDGKDPWSRRDEAIIRLMIETGARAGEVCALEVPDVDLKASTVVIHRSKSHRGRTVPISALTVRAIDRWLRVRRGHALADTPHLWLGDHSATFGYDALWKRLGQRAAQAGIVGFHPHRLRHTAAARWLEKGGTEHGLMAVAGWSNSSMLQRYTRADAERRAADEARRLGLGDL